MEPRFLREPFEVYQARRSHYMTSHQLIDYSRCPRLFKRRRDGLVPEVLAGDWYRIGAAAHCLVCEGARIFDATYCVADGPINPTTGKPYGPETQKFTAWARQQTKPIVRIDEWALLCRLQESICSNDDAQRLLGGGTAEGVIRQTYCGVECQIRIDYYTAEYGIADFKTCDDLDRFEASIATFAYDRQMAFYRAVLRQAIGRNVEVHLVAVEKREPYRSGVWHLSADVLADAELENAENLIRYKQSLADDHWPTLYEGVLEYPCPT